MINERDIVMGSLSEITATVNIVLQDLWRNGRGWILLAVSAGWFLSIGVRFTYPTIVPFLQKEFNLTLTTTGLLLTVLWGAYAVGHIPGGILGDRAGEGNILVISLAISTVTILIIIMSVSVWMLFVGTIAFGLSTALYGPTRLTIFTDIYSHRVGAAIGLTMAAGSVGNTPLPVTAAIIATYATWRLSFGLLVPLFVGTTIALWWTVPNRTSNRTSTVNKLSGHTIKRVVSGIGHESIPIIVSVQVCISFMIQGFSSFYPTYLIEIKGISPGIAATTFRLYFAIGAAVQPLSGVSIDRFGLKKVLIGFLSLTTLSLWLLPFVYGLAQLIAITVLLSSLNGIPVITQTYITDALPEGMQGTGLGMLKAGWLLIGSASPLVIGVLGDFGHLTVGFLLLAVIGSVGLLLSIIYLCR